MVEDDAEDGNRTKSVDSGWYRTPVSNFPLAVSMSSSRRRLSRAQGQTKLALAPISPASAEENREQSEKEWRLR